MGILIVLVSLFSLLSSLFSLLSSLFSLLSALFPLLSLLLISQIALRTCHFELRIRPSIPLPIHSTLCLTIPGPAECAKRLNNISAEPKHRLATCGHQVAWAYALARAKANSEAKPLAKANAH